MSPPAVCMAGWEAAKSGRADCARPSDGGDAPRAEAAAASCEAGSNRRAEESMPRRNASERTCTRGGEGAAVKEEQEEWRAAR